MHIVLSPQRRDERLTISKAGEVLTINENSYDFSELPDGATIPSGEIPCEWIIGPVERVGGKLRLTLILPHGPNPISAAAFPDPIIDPPDGRVALPTDSEDEEEVADVEA